VLVSDDVRDRPKERVGRGRVEGERFLAKGAVCVTLWGGLAEITTACLCRFSQSDASSPQCSAATLSMSTLVPSSLFSQRRSPLVITRVKLSSGVGLNHSSVSPLNDGTDWSCSQSRRSACSSGRDFHCRPRRCEPLADRSSPWRGLVQHRVHWK
jgi:hypothetical protein